MSWNKSLTGLACISVLLALGACTSTSLTRAPVEDAGAAGTSAALPGAENAGKPGYYTVQRGDTLYRIALNSGQSWRNIAQWNDLSDPNVIEVGQVLRVAPPAASQAAVATQSPAANAAAATSGKTPASSTGTTSSAPAAAGSIKLIWPAAGSVLSRFDGSKNKGIDISGQMGDAVKASADGKVVYAGSGLPGYGNLVIVQHNDTFLTAYAHNSKLLVQEEQTVKQGQAIAQMGNSDADRVQLHFEVRRSGKPVDPLTYLPSR